MGRYRKVEVRTWGDQGFCNLSPIPPCGQGLWLFLITGPHTGPIPGLFRAGRASLAEELTWPLEAFDKAFQEVFQEGMVEVDFKSRLVFIPKAISHNKPESPNVVKSWGSEFDLLPECDLKLIAYESLKAFVHGMGEAYGKAFDMTFRKPSIKPSRKAMPNQEQEQEQEQEHISSKLPAANSDTPAKISRPTKKSKNKFTTDQHELAVRMSNPVKTRFPSAKINLDEWADCIRKLIETDKKTREEIIQLWGWIVTHETGNPSGFSGWADNCRSPLKLRQKKDGLPYFDLIQTQMRRELPAANSEPPKHSKQTQQNIANLQGFVNRRIKSGQSEGSGDA